MSRPQVLKRLVAVTVLSSLCSAMFLSTNTSARAATAALPNHPQGSVSSVDAL